MPSPLHNATGFAPGHAKIGGRKKGALNRLQLDLQQMVSHALNNAGGVDYLTKCARRNPVAFLALVGKILAPPRSAEAGDTTINQVIVMERRDRAIAAIETAFREIMAQNQEQIIDGKAEIGLGSEVQSAEEQIGESPGSDGSGSAGGSDWP